MHNTDAKQLLEKYRLGTCNDEERDIVESWYQTSDIGQAKPLSEEVINNSLDRVWTRLNKEVPPMKVKSVWPRFAIAAAVATAIIGLSVFFYQVRHTANSGSTAYCDGCQPGGIGATLTLSNGRKIKLSEVANGELSKESGVVIRKAADGQLVYVVEAAATGSNEMNTLSTANGQTYEIQLPDGSHVWLNAASSITYPASFAEKIERRVVLRGEAYLEVAKDKALPFLVESRGQEVKVLGTHFNVNSYEDEPAMVTTLLEGSVQLRSGNKEVRLHPGEQSVTTSSGIKVTKADLDEATDWKSGDFSLDNVDLHVIMRKIARWYDIDVIYSENISDDIRSVGMISRNKKLSSILEIIEASGQVKFKVEGRKIYVNR